MNCNLILLFYGFNPRHGDSDAMWMCLRCVLIVTGFTVLALS